MDKRFMEKSLDTILQEIKSKYQQMKEGVANNRNWYQQYLKETRTSYQQRFSEFEENYYKQSNGQDVGSLASWGILGWDCSIWHDYHPLTKRFIPPAIRAGILALDVGEDIGDLPALVPFNGQKHIFISGEKQESAKIILKSLLLRIVLSFSPGTWFLNLIDPVERGNTLADFLHLPLEARSPKAYTQADDIQSQIETLDRYVEDVIQNCLTNLYPTIEDYNQKHPAMARAYQIMAMVDFPAGLNEDSARALIRIAQHGHKAGVYIIATINQSESYPRGFNVNQLLETGTVLRPVQQKLIAKQDSIQQGYPIIPDVLPPVETINQWVTKVGDALQKKSTALQFEEIMIPEEQHWQGNTCDEIRVPIGLNSKGDIFEFQLGSGVLHHGLIGGMTGSGKTNLLHVLINQMTLLYPPKELEFYLVDFARGVGFQDYSNLPHARVLALEIEREFSLNILRKLRNELEERLALFTVTGKGIDSIEIYRSQTKKNMSRLLFIMDEFHELFIPDNDDISGEAETIFESLVKQGRKAGIHILLCSQSPYLSGISNKKQIYNQMGIRIALKCNTEDAEAILGEGNDTAHSLQKDGEAIYNDQMGRKDRNNVIRVAWLPGQIRENCREIIRQLAFDKVYAPPITFERDKPASLNDCAELKTALAESSQAAPSSSTNAWLGEPIEIKPTTEASFENTGGANLLVIADEHYGYGMLTASILSIAAHQSPDQVAFCMADFARPSSLFSGHFSKLALPHKTAFFNSRNAGKLLSTLQTLIDQRQSGKGKITPDIYVFLAGLHNWRDLRPLDYEPSIPGRQLMQLAEDGPALGIHFIIWVDTYERFEQALGHSGLRSFDLRVLTHTSENTSNNVLGSPVASLLSENRALFRNETWPLNRAEKFKPFPSPLLTELNAITSKIVKKWRV